MADSTAGGSTNGTAPPMVASSVVVPAQLTQVRVPLEDAADALATPDASGRPPIVVLPKQALRIRNEFVAAGLILLVAALVLDLAVAVRGGFAALGVILVVLGAIRAFFVPVPEGSQAVLLRGGRFHSTLPAGRHVLPPWIIVSHLVTTRETPFDAPATEVPTSDDVRTNVGVVLTFRIAKPELFVFKITVPDFDHICQASCQGAVRSLVRGKTSEEVLDLREADAERLRADIGAALEPYGAEVARVVVTGVWPPTEFVASREGRRLASVQRAEEQELHALELLRLSDRAEQEREGIKARRAAIELEADNEVARLERLDDRIRVFPAAMQWDIDGRRLDVAEALASNTRAMVQVGPDTDLATSLLLQTAPASETPSPATNGRQERPAQPRSKEEASRRGEQSQGTERRAAAR